ncbi:MAG TPA: DUF4258 domain-containing protein [Acidobacteriota bacterium]|nr:DUF4258 domain-containing protein [Acidobacteriota bacterium]
MPKTREARSEINWPETIARCFEEERVVYSRHARMEMRHEEFGAIRDQEVYEATQTCEVVETYPEDQPYPSVLVIGMSANQRPVHVVCAYDNEEDCIIVITVYQPDPGRWDQAFRRRRE